MEEKAELMLEAFDELNASEIEQLAYVLGAAKYLELLHECMYDNLFDMAMSGAFNNVNTIEEAVETLRELPKKAF